MVDIILRLLLLTISIVIVAEIMPGIKVRDFGTGLKVAVVYSIIHFLLSGVLIFFTLPFVLLSLGLFIFVINALLLMFTNGLVEGFEIEGCSTAVIASVLISLINLALTTIFT